MTDKEKLEKLKKLADAMYYAAQHLTTDASRLHKAMDEYHKFIVHEYIEEPEYLEEETKYCAFSTSRYTDKERKVLCDGCEEECRFNKKEESVSKIIFDGNFNKSWYAHPELAFKAGMQEMREQIMAKAVDAVVKIDAGGYPYIDSTIELYDYDKDIPLAKRGDKVKILVIKEK